MTRAFAIVRGIDGPQAVRKGTAAFNTSGAGAPIFGGVSHTVGWSTG
jgi:hypothetical protein